MRQKENKGNIKFEQVAKTSREVAGIITIQLPEKFTDFEVEYSANKKLLPSYEAVVTFEVTLEDGTITTLSGTLPLWLDKGHAREVIKIREKTAREEEERQKKEAILSAFTEDQIELLSKLGVFK